MRKQTLTFEEREALKDKARKKLQALINLGFEVKSINGIKEDKANQIATDLENDDSFILTMPAGMCIVLKVSNMALKLLKPYIKDLLHIEQKTTKTNYILFNYDEYVLEQLMPLAESNEHIQLINTFEIIFNKYTLPNYTNKARLYSVSTAPTLTPKELKKILSLHQKFKNNEDNYFLLSNNISHSYNMPMTILRLLGDNVISLNALNCLEVIMTYATNSTAIYRQPEEDLKLYIIPNDFFRIDDFEINLSEAEILSCFEELRAIGLINYYELIDDVYIIESNIITKSIKQYSYKQSVGYYRGLKLHQQYYTYTFINLIRHIKNIKHQTKVIAPNGEEIQRVVKANKLTITLEGLIYNLELDDYLHDHARLAQILTTLQEIGIQQRLLVYPTDIEPISKATVKYLLSYRDRLHEYFVLNPKDETPETLQSYSNFDVSSVAGRSYLLNFRR